MILDKPTTIPGVRGKVSHVVVNGKESVTHESGHLVTLNASFKAMKPFLSEVSVKRPRRVELSDEGRAPQP